MTISAIHEKAAEGAAYLAEAEKLYQTIGPAIEAAIRNGECTGNARAELIELRHELGKGQATSLGLIARRLRPHIEPTEAANVV
jgi:hypothetical protein